MQKNMPKNQRRKGKMKSFNYSTVLVSMALQLTIQCGLPIQASQRTNDKVHEQLKGLKSVNLVVWVSPFHIPESTEIEQKIEKAVKKVLYKAGLAIGDEQGAVLSIVVDSFSINEKVLKSRLIIKIQTKLLEEAALKRAPTLGNPHGYITWDIDWVELVHRENLETFILGKVKDQVEEFCADWQLARDWIPKSTSLGCTASQYITD